MHDQRKSLGLLKIDRGMAGRLTYREEEIRHIMSDVDSKTDVCEVEPVAQPNKGESDNVVSNKLFKVLSWLLQLQKENDSLLRPVTGLEQVIGLEKAVVRSMRKPFEHGSCVEVPDIGAAHNVKTEGTEDGKIDGGIHLLHEPGRFALSADSAVPGQRTDQTLHQKLARERENNRVEAAECNILRTFTVLNRTARSFRRLGIR